MAHFFGRFFKTTPRKGSPSPAYFEALESRQLLSATYAEADLDATWYIVNRDLHGTITSVAGAETGSIFVGNAGAATAVVDADISLGLDGPGGPTGSIALDIDNGDDIDLITAGRISSNKNLITLGEATSGLFQTFLVKQDTDVTNADLSGSWSFAGEKFSGTLTIGADGKITGGKIKLTNGTYNILKTSTITIDGATDEITIAVKASNGSTTTLVGAMTASDDMMVLRSGDDGMCVATKTAKTGFVATDLTAGTENDTTWFVGGDEANGTLLLKAPVNGTSQIASGSTLTIDVGLPTANTVKLSGSISLGVNGAVTGTFIFNAGKWNASTVKVTGQMNLSKNSIELHSADGTVFMVLTTSADHTGAATKAGTTIAMGTVNSGQGTTLTFDQIKAAMGLGDTDADGEAVDTIYIKNVAGTLTIGDVVQNNDEYIAVQDGDTIKWYTNSGISTAGTVGIIAATSEDAAESTLVSLKFKRKANPSNIAVVTPTAKEPTTVAETDAKSGLVNFTRTSVGAMEIKFDLSGTGVYGADEDYTLALDKAYTGVTLAVVGTTATLTFTGLADALKVGIKIVPQYPGDDIATSDRTVILTMQTPADAYKAGYEIGTKTTSTVTLLGNYAGKLMTISAGTVKTVTEGGYVDLTIGRPTGSTGALNVKVNVAGIESDAYTLHQVTGGVEGAALVGSIAAFDADDITITVRLKLVNDGAVSPSSTIKITLDPQSDDYYTKTLTAVTLTTKEPVLSVVTKVGAVATANVTEGSAMTVSFSVPANVNANTAVKFTLSSTNANLILNTDYAVFAADGTTPLVAAAGVYTVTIAKDSKSVDVVIKALTDTLRQEGTEKLTLTVNDGGYVKPVAKVLNVIDDTTNTLPGVSDVDKVIAIGSSDFIKGDTDGQTITVASLISLSGATDTDSGADLGVKITSIAANVKLYVNDELVVLTGAEANNIIASDASIVVVIETGFTVADAATLFTFQARDAEGGLSVAVTAKGDVVGTEPSMTDADLALAAVAPGASGSLTFAQLVNETDAADIDGDAVVFTISNLNAGITFYKTTGAGTPVAIETATITLAVNETLTWTYGVADGAVNLFDASLVGDATAPVTITVTGTVNNVAPVLSQAGLPDHPQISLVGTGGKVTISSSTFASYFAASDANNDTLTFTITSVVGAVGSVEIDGAAWAAVTNDSFTLADLTGGVTVEWTASTVATPDLVIFTITATDGTATTAAVDFTIDLVA